MDLLLFVFLIFCGLKNDYGDVVKGKNGNHVSVSIKMCGLVPNFFYRNTVRYYVYLGSNSSRSQRQLPSPNNVSHCRAVGPCPLYPWVRG